MVRLSNLVDLLDEDDEKEVVEVLPEEFPGRTPESHVALIISAFVKFDNIAVSKNTSLRNSLWRRSFFSPRKFYDAVSYRKNDVSYALAMIMEKLVGQYDRISQYSLIDALKEIQYFFEVHNKTIMFNHEKDLVVKQGPVAPYAYLAPKHPFAHLSAQYYCSRLAPEHQACAVSALSMVELLELLVMSDHVSRIKSKQDKYESLNMIVLGQGRISARFKNFLESKDL